MAPDLHTLTGVYALDALDDEQERREFEAHLAGCEECREEVRTLRETAALLGVAASTVPPPGLRGRVLAAVGASTQLSPDPIPLRPKENRPRNRGFLAAAASVVLLAGLAAGGAGVVQLREASHDRQVAEAVRAETQRVLAIAADPSARRAGGTVTGGGTITVVTANSGAAVLTDGLKALPDDRIYQLWVVRPGGIVPAGLGPGGADGGGDWSRLVEGARAGDSVAISVEPVNGSAQPTTEPIVVVRT